MLKVICGLDLDGYEPIGKKSHAGIVHVGPLGLLGLLEVRLGLGGVSETRPLRASQYLRCLHQVDNGSRFYSQSIKQDELSVAKTLLDWRDQWIEAGWDGLASADDSARIRDLAEVESCCRKELSPGHADRLRAVLKLLQEGATLALSMTLLDPVEEFSLSWQQLFNLFDAQVEIPQVDDGQNAGKETDLGKLQRALKDGTQQSLQGDGSVVLVKASNLPMLAQATARLSCDNFDPSVSVDWFPKGLQSLLVGNDDLHLIDQACKDVDRPRFNQSAASRWRPPLQVLSLVMGLYWQPLDPKGLLEFLTHPVCPLPSKIRFPLAEVVSSTPGIGGEDWQSKCVELETTLKEETVAAGRPEPDLAQLLTNWIPNKRFDANAGAPIEELINVTSRVAQWATTRGEHPDAGLSHKALFHATTAQASQAQRILDDMAVAGIRTINRLQLDRLLDQVTAEGTTISAGGAELGAVTMCRAPGAAIDSCERIIWWNFVEPVIASPGPLSRTEIAQLAVHGAILPECEALLSSQNRRWQRPVLAARKQLILTVPRSNGAEAVRHHPLWSTLIALCDASVPELVVEEAFTESTALPLVLSKQARQPLPPYQRWWRIGRADLLTGRCQESYSSLESFIKSPYQWVLNYKARLHMGSLHNIETGNRQKGNLMHHLCERLFESATFDWQNVSDQGLERWVDGELARLLPEEGANLFLPGKGAERENFVSTARRSITTLCNHLRKASVVKVEMEADARGQFAGGDLGGYIDMLLTNDRGEQAVLDLKWGGGKYRENDLKKNSAMQLATYSYLKRQGSVWPQIGFFVLSEARLLSQSCQFFKSAEVCDPGLPVDPCASYWQDFETTWQWRRAQLDQGLIEVTVEGTSADAASTPPADGLPIDEHNDSFNDFSVLTGWGENA
jgi:RecB family exonuclease